MATAKKTTKTPLEKKAKSTGAIPVSSRTVAKAAKDQPFAMPMEVKDWIDRAHSIINHQKGEIDRLKKENKELKEWRRWAEHRILRSDHE